MRHAARPPASWLRTIALLVAIVLHPAMATHSPAATSQGSIVVAETAGVPTGTVGVPIALALAHDVTAATLGMTLSVVAVNGAPALRRPISFSAAAELPPPDVLTVQGNDTVRIEWTTPWIPPRPGTLPLGVLQVRLPATAPGQEYDVEVTNLSATSNGSAALLLTAMSGRIGRCSLLFTGQVVDALTGAAIAGAAVCLEGGVTCVQTDGHGLFGGLCYGGQAAGGASVCADAVGYEHSCQGPWTAGGDVVGVDFRLRPAGTGVATPTPSPTPPPSLDRCVGDCDSDGAVDVSELIRGVNIGLGVLPPATCPAFDCSSGCGPGPRPRPPASITCLIRAVNNALTACPPAPCTAAADCDDGNDCSIDLCTPDGCTHACVCL